MMIIRAVGQALIAISACLRYFAGDYQAAVSLLLLAILIQLGEVEDAVRTKRALPIRLVCRHHWLRDECTECGATR